MLTCFKRLASISIHARYVRMCNGPSGMATRMMVLMHSMRSNAHEKREHWPQLRACALEIMSNSKRHTDSYSKTGWAQTQARACTAHAHVRNTIGPQKRAYNQSDPLPEQSESAEMNPMSQNNKGRICVCFVFVFVWRVRGERRERETKNARTKSLRLQSTCRPNDAKDASLLSVLPFDLSNKYVLQQHRQSYNFLFQLCTLERSLLPPLSLCLSSSFSQFPYTQTATVMPREELSVKER